jgi:hypothetical protein
MGEMEVNQTGRMEEGVPSGGNTIYFIKLEKILETNIFGRSLLCAVLIVSLS